MPTRFSSAISLCWVFISVGVDGLYSTPALVVGGVGGLLFLSGLFGGSRMRLSSGAFVLFVAALTAGSLGAPVDATLLSVITAVLAWDAAGIAIGLGSQLGSNARTVRAELVHVGASTIVGAVTIAVGYVVFSLGTGLGSISALVYLVLAALTLLIAARIGSRA